MKKILNFKTEDEKQDGDSKLSSRETKLAITMINQACQIKPEMCVANMCFS
jgi:hypothetical protein